VSDAVGRVEPRPARDQRAVVARDARVHRGVHTSADIALRDGGRTGSISGMRIEWEDAAPILWMGRTLLNGRGWASIETSYRVI